MKLSNVNWGGVASGAGSIVGDVLSFKSARDANKMNREQTEAARRWETDMSNTAHQREVEDLRKAGLNPILSANSGASTPTIPNIPMQPTIKSNVVNNALTALMNKELIKTEKTKQEVNSALSAKTTQEGRLTKVQADFYDTPIGRFVNGAKEVLGLANIGIGVGIKGSDLYTDITDLGKRPNMTVPVQSKPGKYKIVPSK